MSSKVAVLACGALSGNAFLSGVAARVLSEAELLPLSKSMCLAACVMFFVIFYLDGPLALFSGLEGSCLCSPRGPQKAWRWRKMS